jgi:energy-coupling factor transporter ATP-binding protein EcfA2
VLEQTLAQLHADGKTLILASHDIGQSLSMAQRAIVLRQGRLVMDERTAQLDPEAVLAKVIGP